MGQRMKIWATMTSIILLSGMLGFGFSPSALAIPEEGENGQAKGCTESDPRSRAGEQNPHCEEIEIDCDSITDDGAIDAEELQAVRGLGTIDDNQDIIDLIEDVVGNDNGVIDTAAELELLQGFLPGGTICVIN